MKAVRFLFVPFLLIPLSLASSISILNAAPSATFTVNSNLDVPDKKPGNGKCETATNNGVCTLRAAIMETNKLGGTNVINLPAGTFTLDRTGANEDDAKVGDLDIKQNLTIKGAGSSKTIIDGSQSITHDRVFHILSGVVKIQGVAIQNGGDDAADTQIQGGGIYVAQGAKLTLLKTVVGALVGSSGVGNRAAMGGGIYSQGTLTLKRSTISQNSAARDPNTTPDLNLYGGGLFNEYGGTASLVKSKVTENTAYYRGGGIHNDGKLTLTRTVVEYNIADNSQGYYSYGGGIHNSGGTVTLTNSTVQYNAAKTYGGGITNYGDLNVKSSTFNTNSAYYGGGLANGYETAYITNSTFANNTAYADGGAIFNEADGTVYLMNSTIGLNSNYNDVGFSGGLYRVDGTVHLRNTIAAGNSPHDCYGTFNSQDYNLIRSAPACTFTGTTSNDDIGSDPLFGFFGEHGGATETISLQTGSPAIDKANKSGCTDKNGTVLTKDQRGFPRPVNGDGKGGSRCDKGAYEFAP